MVLRKRIVGFILLCLFLLLPSYLSAGLKDNPPKGFLEAIEKLAPEEKNQIYILERIGKFMLKKNPVEPAPVITDRDKEKGYILFSRGYTFPVLPGSTPRPQEKIDSGIHISAARGEYEPVTLSVYPLQDLKGVNLEVTDLTGREGKIKSDNIDIYLVNYLIEGRIPVFKISPVVLCKDRDVLMRKEVCRRYWLTVYVPEDTKAGDYTGKIRVTSSDAPPSEVSLKLTVYPFILPENTDVSFGVYASFARGKGGIKDQKEHGINAVDFGADWEETNGKVRITNIEVLEENVSLLKELNMKGPHLLNPGYNRQMSSPKYDAAYKDAVRQIQDWIKKKGMEIFFWPTDEPRETREDYWRLNFVELKHLLELYKDIPDAKVHITFTGDQTNPEGHSYSETVPLMDVVTIHAGGNAPRISEAIHRHKKTLWLYNSGRFRYSWGFGTWKAGAKGRWEWAYPPASGSSITWPGMYVTTYAPVGQFSQHDPEPRTDWEISREGIDDYRYIYLLESLIKETEKNGDSSQREAAKKAEEYLKKIRNEMPEISTRIGASSVDATDRIDAWNKPEQLNRYRQEIAQFIIRLIKKK